MSMSYFAPHQSIRRFHYEISIAIAVSNSFRRIESTDLHGATSQASSMVELSTRQTIREISTRSYPP
jgi:hypothetical protein